MPAYPLKFDNLGLDDSKVCTVCGILKSAECFKKFKGKLRKDGSHVPYRHGYCKSCRNSSDRPKRNRGINNKTLQAFRLAWPSMADAKPGHWAYSVFVRYGVNEQQYSSVQSKQKGVCPLCDQREEDIATRLHPRLVVDHDHGTGRFRGLVCWTCNFLLGRIKDSPLWLFNAIQYLREPNAVIRV